MPPKRGISIEQRRALRRWAHRQVPKPTQRQCIEWFFQEYNHRLSQSTVSESLSSTFANLDDSSHPTSLRLRTGNWPELEKILFDWQIQIEQEGGVTTGDLLQEKARRIWAQLPQYTGQPCPEFSSRWLERFKKRYHISLRIRHGEAGSIPDSAEDEMRALQTVAGEFQEEDIYNMDETGLFWKMIPSRGLLSQSYPGLKREKARISLCFCVNATGSDRLPVWIIGKAKTPRALRNVSISTMGGRWRWNKKAWMNTTIMCEWLQEFYQHIGSTRQVLLTMDNLSAHYSAIETNPPPSNIRICWLPANSTSRYQPLDQGIIQNFKACYRRQWLQFMLQSIEAGQDPQSAIDIRIAIRWILRSWNNDVTKTTIYNCFRKSTLVSTPISLPTPIIPSGISELYDEVIRTGNIQDSMAMSNFLNPAEENAEEATTFNPDDVLQQVIDDHLGVTTQNEGDDDEEDGQSTQPQYTAKEAHEALQVIINYTESQDALNTDHLRSLERLESAIESLRRQARQQTSLDGWIR